MNLRTFFKSTGSGLGLFLVFLSLGSVNGHVKLNVPRVRLPYFENLSVNFTLQVETPGCYTWSISRSDVVIITPSTNDPENSYNVDGVHCSDSAVISTIPRVSPCCPASAIVFAEDVVTKELVRCDVIIDKITKIQILTITKELHLEEAPSKVHIQGFGSKDNELSTLDGVPFNWVLESPKQTSTIIDPQSIMRFIPFSESLYKATAGVALLETKRMQGDTVLLEGIKTGSAEVIVRVADPLYKDLEARARIVVVASLHLDPHDAYIAPGTVLPLKLWQMKHGKKFEIKLPSSVYEFNVENATVISYDTSKSQISALDYGETTISVTDKNCLDELEEQPEALTATIHVIAPKYLSLTILPHKNWAIQMGQTYEIQVDVFDVKNQKIYIGNNLFVETTFDPMYFRVDYSSPNGTYHIGVPIRQGSAYVKAVLKKIVLIDGSELTLSPQPRVRTEMEIFQTIALNPKETILPWDPNVMPKYELRWNPSGGNGNFVWSSSNTSVVTVSQSATGKTEWFGSVNVTAASSVNPHIKGVARVHVLPPIRMAIVEHIVEAEVGSVIQVPLAFYTIRPNDPNKTEVPYSSCNKLPLNVEVQDHPNFVYDEKTHYPNLKPACVVLPIMGNALGSSMVTVTYSVGNKHFEDSVTVSTFKPLKTVEPKKDLVVLAIGSSKQIVFEGGPRPLLEKHSGFSKTLMVENDEVASHRPIKIGSAGLKDDVYVYEILCKEIGETNAVFQIGNSKVTESSQPIVRIQVVTVVCAEPAQMYFKVETSIKTKCPNDGSAAQVVRVAVPNYENTQISVIVKDKEGRKFDNVTSLLIDWKSTPTYLDFATSTFAVTEPVQTVLGYLDTGKALQTVIPNGKSGNVEVSARVKGYRDEVLKFYGIKSRKFAVFEGRNEEDLIELEHSMDLQLVSDVTVEPSASINLFNHPSSKAIVKVRDGSGFFAFKTIGTQNINVSYNEGTKTLEIKPLIQGKARIILKDLCVSTKKDTVINVDITGIGKIEVVSEDKIPLEGERIMTVSLHDDGGKVLPIDIVKLVQLSLIPMGSDILKVTQIEPKLDSKDSKLQFKVQGKHVGVAEVVFGAGNILSIPKVISVFPPLKLSPREITILEGNKYKIEAKGGPDDAEIIFSSEKQNIAWISASGTTGGEIKGDALGKSVITGRAVDPQNHRKVYSEDTVEVNVVALTGLKIISPLHFVYENEKIPMWIKGLAGKNEIHPGFIANAKPTLSGVEWLVSSKDNGEIILVFKERDMFYDIGKHIRVQFFARKAGNITIEVRATYNKVRIISQKFEMDIRKYPFGYSSEYFDNEPSSLWSFFILLWSTAYYWMILPTLLAIAMAIGSITYNGYLYGQYGNTGTRADTAYLVTNPQFLSTPHSYSPSHSRGVSPNQSFGSSPGGAGDGLQPHNRLYSVPDSGVYSNSKSQQRY